MPNETFKFLEDKQFAYGLVGKVCDYGRWACLQFEDSDVSFNVAQARELKAWLNYILDEGTAHMPHTPSKFYTWLDQYKTSLLAGNYGQAELDRLHVNQCYEDVSNKPTDPKQIDRKLFIAGTAMRIMPMAFIAVMGEGDETSRAIPEAAEQDMAIMSVAAAEALAVELIKRSHL